LIIQLIETRIHFRSFCCNRRVLVGVSGSFQDVFKRRSGFISGHGCDISVRKRFSDFIVNFEKIDYSGTVKKKEKT
jgi:hypothetical protein